MSDMKHLMREHYLRYASYVILDRAIPDLVDGLKPVQRRILHALLKLHDGKLHKVANVVGQTMAFHPHGEAAIYEALVTMAGKGFLFDTQGNFGNLLTGDSAAAARYIETRLSGLAVETMFNPKITEFIPSYDGRNSEPVALPAKIPLLLMQGAEGIAVGMATKILPHNFIELLEAEIQVLRGETTTLYPDFLTGGLMDVSEYDDGKGKVRLRCTIEEKTPKVVVIKEICATTTTESLIASIEDAAKKGKIKIDAIHDYTSDQVEIEIHLPRGTYAKDTIEQLYAFTDCEVSISSQMVVIVDGLPKIISVTEAVEFYAKRLKWCLQKELEIELEEVKRSIFYKTLERIFIDEKIYQSIEKVDQFEKVYGVLAEAFAPYHKELIRPPEKEDFDALLKIPIRRIAKFDRDKNSQECKALEDREAAILKSLSSLTKYTIRYLEGLVKRYREQFPRKTRVKDLEVVDRRSMQVKQIEVGVDTKKGYVGTAVKGNQSFSCTNFDKILVLLSDGTYKVVNSTDRAYLAKTSAHILHCGVADKTKVFTACYRDPSTGLSFCKRFIVKKFIIDREYRFIEEGHELLLLSEDTTSLLVQLLPKPRQRVSVLQVESTDFPIKGVSAKGNRLSRRPVMAVQRELKKK